MLKLFVFSEVILFLNPPKISFESEDFSLLVTFLLVNLSWLSVAVICLEKQCLRLLPGFFVALILGKVFFCVLALEKPSD